MRSRQLTLGILLAFVLITVAASSIYAAHTTPLTKTNRGVRVTLTVGSIDANGNFTFTANGANNPKVISWIENVSSSGLTCSVVLAGDTFDTAGSYRCYLNNPSAIGTVNNTSVTVTVGNKSATTGDGARIVFTEGQSANVWSAKNYVLKNTLAASTNTPIAVRLDVEITLDDKTNALLSTGTGRGHASIFKAQFYSCLTASSLCALPTGDRFIGTSEFVYFDDNTSGLFFEQVGGGTGAAVKIDYPVNSTNPANMGSGKGKCVAEGDPDDPCDSSQASLTKCPSNFGSCITMENLFSRMIYRLAPQHVVVVGAGTNSGSGVPINEQIGACAVLQSFQAAESTFGEGSCQVEVFGSSDVDLRTCDWEGATAGIGGTGMTVQNFSFQSLDSFESLGPGVKDDAFVLFEGESGAGNSCLGPGHEETLQVIVTCPVLLACDNVKEQGNGFRLVSSTSAVFDVPLVCSMPVEVTPCP
jgi:hypothetical protein